MTLAAGAEIRRLMSPANIIARSGIGMASLEAATEVGATAEVATPLVATAAWASWANAGVPKHRAEPRKSKVKRRVPRCGRREEKERPESRWDFVTSVSQV